MCTRKMHLTWLLNHLKTAFRSVLYELDTIRFDICVLSLYKSLQTEQSNLFWKKKNGTIFLFVLDLGH